MENVKQSEEIDLYWPDDRLGPQSEKDFYRAGFMRCDELRRKEQAETLAMLSEAAGLKRVPFKRI